MGYPMILATSPLPAANMPGHGINPITGMNMPIRADTAFNALPFTKGLTKRDAGAGNVSTAARGSAFPSALSLVCGTATALAGTGRRIRGGNWRTWRPTSHPGILQLPSAGVLVLGIRI